MKIASNAAPIQKLSDPTASATMQTSTQYLIQVWLVAQGAVPLNSLTHLFINVSIVQQDAFLWVPHATVRLGIGTQLTTRRDFICRTKLSHAQLHQSSFNQKIFAIARLVSIMARPKNAKTVRHHNTLIHSMKTASPVLLLPVLAPRKKHAFAKSLTLCLKATQMNV